MKTYKILLTLKLETNENGQLTNWDDPSGWNWHLLLGLEPNESVTARPFPNLDDPR